MGESLRRLQILLLPTALRIRDLFLCLAPPRLLEQVYLVVPGKLCNNLSSVGCPAASDLDIQSTTISKAPKPLTASKLHVSPLHKRQVFSIARSSTTLAMDTSKIIFQVAANLGSGAIDIPGLQVTGKIGLQIIEIVKVSNSACVHHGTTHPIHSVSL